MRIKHMKVLMPVLHYFPVIGGLEKWTQEIAQGNAEKAEVFVLTGQVKGQSKQEILNRVQIKRTGIFVLTNLSRSSLFYIFATLPFLFFASWRLIKKEKIEILHCQGFLSGLLGFLLKKLSRIKYIITVQSEQKKTFIKKLIYQNADFCIAASRTIADYFKEIGCKNVKIIPNGINLDKFSNVNQSRQKVRQQLGIKENDFVIITVARLEKIKGIDYLLRAIQMSEVSPQTFIVGEGGERKNLENLAKKLKIADKVKFFGQVENNKIPFYLSAGDCFCLPSLSEGFGIVILEAMACELPVVASNVGGIPDIIENNNNGILVESANSQELKIALQRIADNPDLAKTIVLAAKNNLHKYNWRNIAEQVREIYEGVINNKHLSA